MQFYLTLLDTYVPDPDERRRGVRGGREHPVDPGARPSSASGGSTRSASSTALRDARRTGGAFLLNLICFAACIEGLFFFGAFAYVYFLRSRGLLTGSPPAPTGCSATRAMHMAFAFEVVDTVRERGARPVRRRARRSRSRDDARRGRRVRDCSSPRTCSASGVAGPVASPTCAQYLEYVADQRLAHARAAAALRRRRTRSRSWSCRTCRS